MDIQPQIKETKTEIENVNQNYEYKPKSIKIDISKEDEEDKELLSLLEEKRKLIILWLLCIKIALTSQNKYKKKIIFDVIEEEEDEDKNKNINKKIEKEFNVIQSLNIEKKIENELDFFIDSKYSNIDSNANNKNIDKKFEINCDDFQTKNKYSKINNNNNKQDKKIELLFDNKIKNSKDKKNNLKWNHSSNIKKFESNIFNKFSEDTYLGQKIFKDFGKEKEKNLFLPSIKSKNLYEKKNVLTSQINTDPLNDLKNINFLKNKVINMNSNNYINDNTQATTLITYSTKKFSSSKNNNMKSMNNDQTQFGMGLITAGSTTNNNIIIPILTKARPESNFNCGGGILKNFNENYQHTGLIQSIDNSKNIRQNKSRNFRKKVCKSQEVQKRINNSMKKKEIYQLFPEIQKIMPNFHKIKIEKGMTNIKF